MALKIPKRNSSGYHEFRLDQLETDPTEIIDVLKREYAPLPIWLECAVHYYKKANYNAFKDVLSVITDKSSVFPEYYKSDKTSLIAIFNALAAYYIRQARMSTEKAKTQNNFTQATQLFHKADSLDIHEEITWVGKGILLLFRRELVQSRKQFQTVLDQNDKNIPALLGQACIFYHDGKYVEACNVYRKVIRMHPGCPASVRIGLANCFHKLNKPDLARQALERVLEMNPETDVKVDTLVGLAILAKNEGRPYAKLLEQAFQLDNTNSKVLNQLANYYFFKKDYGKSAKLATNAYQKTNLPKIQAESYYYLGRLDHHDGKYANAIKYYQQAQTKASDFPLPQFGLGQIYIEQKEKDKAIKSFEKVLEMAPDNVDTLKILGSLLAEQGKKERGITLLTKAAALRPTDVETLTELAQLLQQTDYQKSLDWYLEVVRLLGVSKKVVPPEVWNNIGVLQHKLRAESDYKLAEKCYRRALIVEGDDIMDLEGEDEWNILSLFEGPTRVALFKPINVTTLYNLARLYEDVHLLTRATEIYQNILKEHPNYLDCYMRLGYMKKSVGDTTAASDYFKEALSVTGPEQKTSVVRPATNNPSFEGAAASAAVFLAALQAMEAQSMAQKKLDFVLQANHNRQDPYVNCQLGNIFLETALVYPEKKDHYLRHARDYFLSVLGYDKANLYAANGLAIIAHHQNQPQAAKEFLLQIKESCGSVKVIPVWVNLANINLIQGNFDTAIRLYKACLKEKLEGKDEDVILLHLSKAYYEFGQYEDCKNTLKLAIRRQPWDKDLWFNLALAMEKNAQSCNKIPNRTTKDYLVQLSDYQACSPIFEALTKKDVSAGATKVNYSSTKCNVLYASSRENFELTQSKYETRKLEEEIQAQKQEEYRQRMREEQEFLRQQEELEKEIKAAEAAQMEEEAELVLIKVSQLQREWAERKDMEAKRPKVRKPSKPRKKKENPGQGDDEEEGQEEGYAYVDEEDEEGDEDFFDREDRSDPMDEDEEPRFSDSYPGGDGESQTRGGEEEPIAPEAEGSVDDFEDPFEGTDLDAEEEEPERKRQRLS